MKILTLTFYKDFARYFSYLEYEAKKTYPGCSFDHLALYPCAQNFFKKQGLDSRLLPFVARVNKNNDLLNGSYRGYDLVALIQYSVKALQDHGSQTEIALKRRAAAYVDYFENLFQQTNYDVIICAGDTRVPIEACIAVAKKFKIKIWYFEQGPFGTTMIDDCGVNANASFSGKFLGSQCPDSFDIEQYLSGIRRAAGGKYWVNQQRSIMDRCIDIATLVLMYPPRLLGQFLPQDLSSGTSFGRFLLQTIQQKMRRKHSGGMSEYQVSSPYIALLLQVPNDAQMLIHSPHYREVSELVADVIKNAPEGYNIIIREHPLHTGRYGENLYRVVAQSSNAAIGNNVPFDSLIDGAAVVVVNNSTSGLDAMRRGKTVVVLGSAYYANEKVVYHLKSKEKLRELLLKSVHSPVSPAVIDDYLCGLLQSELVPGHFQDKNLSGAKEVLGRIFGEINFN